jgi:hypothetical protein
VGWSAIVDSIVTEECAHLLDRPFVRPQGRLLASPTRLPLGSCVVVVDVDVGSSVACRKKKTLAEASVCW